MVAPRAISGCGRTSARHRRGASGFASALLAMAALMGFAVGSASAHGCRCERSKLSYMDPRERLEHADGAVIGTVVAKSFSGDGERVLAVRPRETFKFDAGGDIDVATGGGAECSLGFRREGDSLSQLLTRAGNDGWSTGACDSMTSADLHRAGQPLPRPTGGKRVELVVAGAFGPVRSIALDQSGRVVSYGQGAGRVVAASVCPGARRMVEVVLAERLQPVTRIAIRELPGLHLVRSRTFPGFAGDVGSVSQVECLDRRARNVLLIARSHVMRVVRMVNATSFATVYSAQAEAAVLAGSRAYAVQGSSPSQLISIDTTRRTHHRVGRLPGRVWRLSGDRTGRFAALVSPPTDPVRGTVVSYTPGDSSRRLHTASLPEVERFSQLLWSSHGHLVVVPYSGRARVFDATLRHRLGMIGLPTGGPAVLRGETLYMIRRHGLYRARLSAHGARRVRDLPVSVVTTLAGTPDSAASAPRAGSACVDWSQIGRVTPRG